MARPRKKGLDYFPLDTDFDDELEGLVYQHGNDALAVMIRFWQAAYKTDDGVLDYSGVIRRITLAKRANISEKKLENIITDASEVGLIDPDALKDGMLTSRGVRKRIEKVVQEREKARQKLFGSYSANNGGRTPEEFRNNGGKRKRKRKVLVQSTNKSPNGDLPRAREELFSPDDRKKLISQLGPDEAAYWLEEVQLAYEQNPIAFTKKYKDPVAVARNWRRRRLAEGCLWDPEKKLYTKPQQPRFGAPDSRERLRRGAELAAKYEREEQERPKP